MLDHVEDKAEISGLKGPLEAAQNTKQPSRVNDARSSSNKLYFNPDNKHGFSNDDKL